MIVEYSDANNDKICMQFDINLLDGGKTTLISETEISNILEAKNLNPVGKSFPYVQTDEIERELLKNSMIKSVECYKTISGNVILTVKQRTPKFMIAGNECYYVDSERKIMPVSLNYAAYVPVVSGRILRSMATGDLFDFISFLEKDAFWNAQIEQIFVRDDLTIELVPRVGEAVIYLGKLENYNLKLRNLRQLYEQAFNVIGWNRYQKIDLQYQSQIVCTKTGTVPEILKPDTAVVKDSLALKKI